MRQQGEVEFRRGRSLWFRRELAAIPIWIACASVLLVEPAGSEPALPRCMIPVGLTFQDSLDFVAVCVAEEGPRLGDAYHGKREVRQRFRSVGLVVGEPAGFEAREVLYHVDSEGLDRPVREAERVIWMVRREGSAWRGVHVLADTPENRLAVYRHAEMKWSPRNIDWGLSIELPSTVLRGTPILAKVGVSHSEADSLAVWSSFDAMQFEILPEDDGGREVPPMSPVLQDRNAPRMVGPTCCGRDCDNSEIVDLTERCSWLPSRSSRSFTLLWRGAVRVGDRNAMPVEVISRAFRLTVLDPATMSWGSATNGAVSGLAAETLEVRMGERVLFHFGFRADPTLDPEVHLERWRVDDMVHFSFRNLATGEQYERDQDARRGGPRYIPSEADFVPLRESPPLLWSIPIRLVNRGGEQIPPGDYEVVATFAGLHGIGKAMSDRSFTLLQGQHVSGPVPLRVLAAAPDSVEILVRSGIETMRSHGWTWSFGTSNSRTMRVLRHPGFRFSSVFTAHVAVDGGEFERIASGGVHEWGSFWHILPRDPASAIDAGRRVDLRVEMAVYESSDWYPRFAVRQGPPLHEATFEVHWP